MQRRPSRLRVKAASRCSLELGGETPPQLAGADACATSFLETLEGPFRLRNFKSRRRRRVVKFPACG